MNEIDEKKEKIVSKIEATTDLLYQQKIKEGYMMLQELIEEILIFINELVSYSSENHMIQSNINEISTLLKNALNAMEQQDTVLVADILRHDMISNFR